MLTTIEDIGAEGYNVDNPRSLIRLETLTKQYGLTQATSDYEAILSNPDVDKIHLCWNT